MNQLASGELIVNTDYSDLAQDLEATYGSKSTEILRNVSENPSEFLGKFSPEQLSDMGLSETSNGIDIAKALVNPDNATTLSTIHELSAAMATAATEHGAISQVQIAQNVAEAKATVHPSGVSIEDMLKNEINRHIDSGAMKIDNPEQYSQQLIEKFGGDAYKVFHSACAEPTNIAAELKASMSPEDFVKDILKNQCKN